MKTSYVKMQALGNEFIVFSGPMVLTPEDIIKVCNRQSGVGADGVLVVEAIDRNKISMKYWNADGSIAEMCGNGLRCVARYAVDNKLVEPGEFTVVTLAGPLKAVWDGKEENQIEVQVGLVSVNNKPLELYGLKFYKASVGNPHAITFVDDVDEVSIATLGPKVEFDSNFPNRTNVEFVQIISQNIIKMRVWERGVGETQACGTGMVAVAIATNVLKGSALPSLVQVPGGNAKVWVDSKGYGRIKSTALIITAGTL